MEQSTVTIQSEPIPIGWQLAVEAGVEMLRAGAETSRVEDTVERIGRAIDASRMDAYVTPTGIFVSMDTKDARTLTTIRRIRDIEYNISVVVAINSISRDVAHRQIDPYEGWQRLQAIKAQRRPYSLKVTALAAATVSGAFAYLFQGQMMDMVFAWLTGCCLAVVTYRLRHLGVNLFLRSWVGGSLAALWGLLALALPVEADRDVVILGGLMVLVPGATITGAVRDIMSGELVSGVSRAAEAFMIALAIAVGVATVLGLGGVL